VEVSTKFGSENLKVRDHSEYLGVDERIILELILKEWVWRVWECICLGKDMDQWRGLVNTVMSSSKSRSSAL
jgi:hypothetical protein